MEKKPEYELGNSFPFDFEPNRIQFGSKLKGNLSPQSYSIQLERKWISIFLIINPNCLSATAITFRIDYIPVFVTLRKLCSHYAAIITPATF